MELFEDLEFKPLTEGLGFHRNQPKPQSPSPQAKAPNLSSPLKTNLAPSFAPTPMPIFAPTPKNLVPPRPSDATIKAKMPFIPSLKPEYNFLDEDSMSETKKFAQELNQPKQTPDRTKIYQQPPRREFPLAPNLPKTSEAARKPVFSIPVPGAPASLSALRNQSISQMGLKKFVSPFGAAVSMKPAVAAGPKTKAPDLTLVTCVPAAILDAVFAFGVSLILLVGVLLVTKSDLVGLLSNSQTDRFVQVQIGILFLMVLEMYTLLARSTVFGQSIGEWTYDIQLGTDEQKQKAIYPIQVVFRGLLFAATGFVIIPILSELFGKDLAAALTGLELRKTTHETK